MNVIVQGTKDFKDYSIFLRAMSVAMSGLKEDEFNIYTVGPATINNYTAEFSNKIESSMRARGKRVKFYRVPVQTVEESLDKFAYFAFFATPGEKLSPLYYAAQATDMETAVFRF
jgi:hypothetical protein